LRLRALAGLLLLCLPGVLLHSAQPVLVTGTVTDLAGHPLEGVKITAVVEEGDVPSATSDEEGLFWMELPERVPLQFALDGFVRRESTPGPEEHLIIRLLRAAALRVEVLDPEDKPIKGAEVALLESSRDPPSFRGKKEKEKEEREPIAEAGTDKFGVATLGGMAHGQYDIRVRAEGYSEIERWVGVEAGKTATRRIQLQRLIQVTGRIVGPDGRPPVGAEIAGGLSGRRRIGTPDFPWERGYQTDPRFKPKARSKPGAWTKTDKEGRFRLEGTLWGEPPTWSRILVAVAPGFAPTVAWRQATPDAPSIAQEIVLQPAGELRGRVVDEEGNGVTGIRLFVRTSIPYVAEGVEGEEREELETQALLLHTLLGETQEGEPGFPVGAEGHFAIPRVPAGIVRLIPWRPDHDAREPRILMWEEMERQERGEPPEEGPPADTLTLRTESGAVHDGLRLVFRERRSLAGLVEDERGEPILDARVVCRFGEYQMADTRTAGGGRFQLTGLSAEKIRSVEVSAEGYGPEKRKMVPTGGSEPLLFRLKPAGSISGRVFDADTGQPVAPIALRAIPRRKGKETLGRRTSGHSSDPDGAFQVTGVPEGAYDLEVHAHGYLWEVVEKVEVLPRQETPLHPVHLKRGGEIRGVVVGKADALPISGVSILVAPFDSSADRWPFAPSNLGSNRKTTTDDRGEFQLAGVPYGDVRVHVHHVDYPYIAVPATINPDKETPLLDISMGQGGKVEISLLTADGDPARGLVTLQGEETEGIEWMENGRRRPAHQTGRVLFERVPAGRYTAVMASSRGQGKDVEIEVRDGETTRLTLKEEAGTIVTGSITYGGAPVQGAELSVWVKGENGSRTMYGPPSAAGERYETEPLLPGKYLFEAKARVPRQGSAGYRELQLYKSVEVPEGIDRMEVGLAFSDQMVSGRVTREATGEGVEGVRVLLQKVGGSHGAAPGSTTDSRGSFVLLAPDPGTYKVVVHLGGKRQDDLGGWRLLEEQQVSLEQGEKIEGINLRIGPGYDLKGTVRGPDGRPLTGVRIQFVPVAKLSAQGSLPFGTTPPWRSYRSGTDSEGAFLLEGLSAAEGILYVGHHEFAPRWFPGVRPGDGTGPRDIILEVGGALEVILPSGVDPESRDMGLVLTLGRPDLPLPVVIEGGGHSGGSYVQVTAAGSLLLPHLPEGTWTVDATMEDAARRIVVEIHEGQRSQADFSDL